LANNLSHRISNLIQTFRGWVSDSKGALIFSVIYLLIGTIWVYSSPRSLPAFLLFISSALLIFILPISSRAKLGLVLIILLVLVPILGVRNIFYLEVIFQIAVFAALALGLNIVVGFAGLLDLGYVAFYAVGAYLWAFFGSQQPYLLHAIPGTAPPGTPFFLPGDAFYVFIALGVIVAAYWSPFGLASVEHVATT
jgi:branched-chain amino acid transport system permease protein